MSAPLWSKIMFPLPTAIYDAIDGGGGGSRKKSVPSMKRGGRVKKTGLVRLHQGEQVIPAGRSKKGKRGKKRFGSGRM